MRPCIIAFSEIKEAYHFVNSAHLTENRAFVSRSTGKTYWQSEVSDIDELPEGGVENEDYLNIPDSKDLGLGTRLVEDFVRQFVPELHGQVREAFSRRGAYSRFKRILERHDMLEKWFEYEETRTTEALIEWCRANSLHVDFDG